MPNPMGGMGGPKPCMMGGPHMGPRMMPGPNLNAMNGKKLSVVCCDGDKVLVSIIFWECTEGISEINYACMFKSYFQY